MPENPWKIKNVWSNKKMATVLQKLFIQEPVSDLSTAELVDQIGFLNRDIADAEKRKKEISEELLKRHGTEHYIDGNLYTATVVSESIVWTLDQIRLKDLMGSEWLNKFLKHGIRKAYLKVTARKI